MFIDVAALFVTATAADLLNLGLNLAQAAGLPVTSWRAGDPIRSLYKYLAEVLATLEGASADYVKSAFLSKATGDWLTVLASEVYGVDRTPSSPSTPTVTILNTGGGVYTDETEPGNLTFKCSVTGVTFHNTNGPFTFETGDEITLELVADVDGSAGTVAVDDIDEMVTTLLGVIIGGSTASIGVDEQDDDSLKTDCRDTLGALSPDGPADAYEYVVRQSKFTGVTTITRSRSTNDDPTGQVTVYVAGPDGAVDGASVTAAQAAIDTWATPLTITATATNATPVAVDVTATITGTDVPADFEARLTEALERLLARQPIADETGGTFARSLIFQEFHNTLDLTSVTLTVPAADVAYTEGEVPVIGTVAITEV